MAAVTANGHARTKAAPPASPPASSDERVQIKAPRIRTAEFKLIGTAPLVQNSFSAKAMNQMREKQEAGSQAGSKKTRKARDFKADFENACHVSEEGWYGVPAAAFRSAMIDACRLVGFKMTVAKLSVFILADGLDRATGDMLVKLSAGKPKQHIAAVRNATGVADLRSRPMWTKWGLTLRVQFDEDQFSLADVTNLLHRAGIQVGIGEGRPNSKEPHGMGWGTFTIEM
jgi:hypothetical protein